MRRIVRSLVATSSVMVAMVVAPSLHAQQAQAPKNATAQCKDGTYSTAKTQRGACAKHGGIATWLATEAPTEPNAKSTTPPAAQSTATPPPAAPRTTNPPPASAERPAQGQTTPTEARPAGSPENATAQCNDGTYSFAKHHSGACSGHKGVKTWFK